MEKQQRGHENKHLPEFENAHQRQCTVIENLSSQKERRKLSTDIRQVKAFYRESCFDGKCQDVIFTWTSSRLARLGFPTDTSAIFPAKSWSWFGTRTHTFLRSSPTRPRTQCPVFPISPSAVHWKAKQNKKKRKFKSF